MYGEVGGAQEKVGRHICRTFFFGGRGTFLKLQIWRGVRFLLSFLVN